MAHIFSRLWELATRIFSRRSKSLQPNDILQWLYSELEEKKKVGIDDCAYVPNNFTVHLCKIDLEDLAPLLGVLPEQLTKRLEERITRNGYKILAPISVRIKEDTGLEMNCIDVESCFTSKPGDENASPVDAITNITGEANTHIAEEQKTCIQDNSSLKLEIVEGENIGDIIQLRHGFHTFGRSHKSTVLISDDEKTVSREHFEIEVASGKAKIKDLGSLNYTKVNTVKVDTPTELTIGDLITAGNVVLKVV